MSTSGNLANPDSKRGMDSTEGKREEQALSASEIRYRRLFETAQDGILILNAETGMIIDVNPFLIELLGISHDEFLGKKVWELGVLKDIVANQDKLEELQLEGHVRYENLPLETSDGRQIEVEFVSNVHQENHQKVIQCNIRDISERKRMEKNLRESEKNLLLSLGAARAVAWVKELSSNKVKEIGPVDEIFGKPAEFHHMDQQSFIQDIHPDDRARVVAALQAGAKGESRVYSVEFRVPLAAGGVRWLQASGHFECDSGNRPTHVRGIMRDITERKLEERARTASEIRYRRLFEAARDGILILDAETGMVVDVNPFLAELMGYPHEAFLGKEVWELGFFNDIVANLDKFVELQQKGYVRYENLPLETADGRRIQVEFVSNVYLVNDVKVIQCNIRDITERKRVEEELRKAKNAAETANRAKSDFLSSMSHELRTPLNAVIGFSEVLADRTFGVLNEKQVTYVDNVLEAGRYLLNLINDILDLSKVESGKMKLEFSTFPLATVLDNSLVMVKERCMKQGIALSLDVSKPILDLEISADARKLKQILFNLLSNAVKFTLEKGSITVSARMVGESIGVSGYGSKGVDRSLGDGQSTGRSHSNTPTPPHTHTPALLISVADTGIGIKPEDQERIFREFEQVDSSDTPKYQGTGLGLALVKRFVELHSGRVWVESEFGKGSTFRLTIPTGK